MKFKVSKKTAVRIIRAIDWFESNVEPWIVLSLMAGALSFAARWFAFLWWEV